MLKEYFCKATGEKLEDVCPLVNGKGVRAKHQGVIEHFTPSQLDIVDVYDVEILGNPEDTLSLEPSKEAPTKGRGKAKTELTPDSF
jgi:hypothetical protein